MQPYELTVPLSAGPLARIGGYGARRGTPQNAECRICTAVVPSAVCNPKFSADSTEALLSTYGAGLGSFR